MNYKRNQIEVILVSELTNVGEGLAQNINIIIIKEDPIFAVNKIPRIDQLRINEKRTFNIKVNVGHCKIISLEGRGSDELACNQLVYTYHSVD